jgi:aspartyl-tRNA(Asn)/glutamyl-tRNA(Gln) amidotransferase subunit C
MSKNITIKEIEYTADLARLIFTDEEKQKFAKDLDNILGYFKDLAEAETEGVEKINHYDLIGDRKNHFRGDVLKPADDKVKKGIKDNFPASKGNLLAVKSILSR